MKDNFNNQFATQRLRTEVSATAGPGSATFTPGTGEQTAPRATKKVVRKKVKKEEKDVEPKLAAGEAENYVKDHWGWKEAPSVPNRPSKGGFIYKQLFEMKVSDLELDYPEFAGVVEYVADYLGLDLRAVHNADIKNANDDYFEIVNIPGEEGKTVFVEIARVGKVLHLNITTSGPTYSNVAKTTVQLQENYSRFKKETKTRTNEQQLHAAMRLAEKKIHEANRILEYTSQLRGELNETRVNKNTQKLMEKITRGIAEAYGKMKKLK